MLGHPDTFGIYFGERRAPRTNYAGASFYFPRTTVAACVLRALLRVKVMCRTWVLAFTCLLWDG